jgi:hypothetical protein
VRFVILGGGCYGTFYTRQLIRAADARAIPRPDIVVVDHGAAPAAIRQHGADPRVRHVRSDWQPFFAQHLAALADDTDDQIVPPPLTPHLAMSWLLDAVAAARPEISWQTEPFGVLPATPFARQAGPGTLTASHADWICPVHCIEPAICPKTRGPRDWDMADTAARLTQQLAAQGQPVDQLHLFQCLHFTHGVGTYPAAALLRARRALSGSRPTRTRPVRALIGTVSRCHGALHLLKGTLGTDTVSPRSTSSHATLS